MRVVMKQEECCLCGQEPVSGAPTEEQRRTYQVKAPPKRVPKFQRGDQLVQLRPPFYFLPGADSSLWQMEMGSVC